MYDTKPQTAGGLASIHGHQVNDATRQSQVSEQFDMLECTVSKLVELTDNLLGRLNAISRTSYEPSAPSTPAGLTNRPAEPLMVPVARRINEAQQRLAELNMRIIHFTDSIEL